jgi:large subunit ribosomal protein L4
MPKQKTESAQIETPIYNIEGKVVGSQVLPEEIFGIKLVPQLVAQAIRVYLANQRLGTKSTKTRSMVTGSTRKIYKQKGTGRARHGDVKAPTFIGGGVAHGPKPKDYSLTIPKKMRRKALFSVLSEALNLGKIKVVKGLDEIQTKTRELALVFDNLGIGSKKELKGKTLLVVAADHNNILLSGRNIQNLTVMQVNQLNTYEILNHKAIVFMLDAIKTLENIFVTSKKMETEKETIEKTVKIKKEVKKTIPPKTEKKLKIVKETKTKTEKSKTQRKATKKISKK